MTTREAVEAMAGHLRNYQQADEDGVMVLVSRQACEEAAAMLLALLGEREELSGNSEELAAELSPAALKQWLIAKWRRHREVEDLESARLIVKLQIALAAAEARAEKMIPREPTATMRASVETLPVVQAIDGILGLHQVRNGGRCPAALAEGDPASVQIWRAMYDAALKETPHG